MRLKRALTIVIIITVVFILLVTATGIVGARENKKLVVTEYSVKNEKIPNTFNGFRIVQISDFHNPEDAEFVNRIVDKVKECNPDIIAVTGDLIDSRNTRIDIALDFMEKIKDFAPVYYVTGNHEGRITEYQRLENGIEALEISVLENECVELEKDGKIINLVGLQDPVFNSEKGIGGKRILSRWIREIGIDRSHYTVLLEHRPEYCAAFETQKIELALTGHAHGGQVRLPFIGGLFSPGQGLLPEYDGGMYELDGTTMIVSRGIGNSAFPVRINNPPEIVVVTLEKTENVTAE